MESYRNIEKAIVSRDRLRKAIESGIAATEQPGRTRIPSAYKAALRSLAGTAEIVGVGTYEVYDTDDLSHPVACCPVCIVEPNWALLTWDLTFASAFDDAILTNGEAGVRQRFNVAVIR